MGRTPETETWVEGTDQPEDGGEGGPEPYRLEVEHLFEALDTEGVVSQEVLRSLQVEIRCQDDYVRNDFNAAHYGEAPVAAYNLGSRQAIFYKRFFEEEPEIAKKHIAIHEGLAHPLLDTYINTELITAEDWGVLLKEAMIFDPSDEFPYVSRLIERYRLSNDSPEITRLAQQTGLTPEEYKMQLAELIATEKIVERMTTWFLGKRKELQGEPEVYSHFFQKYFGSDPEIVNSLSSIDLTVGWEQPPPRLSSSGKSTKSIESPYMKMRDLTQGKITTPAIKEEGVSAPAWILEPLRKWIQGGEL